MISLKNVPWYWECTRNQVTILTKYVPKKYVPTVFEFQSDSAAMNFGFSLFPSTTCEFRKLFTALAAVAMTVASAMELTPDTWDSATAGKTIFVKFLAPW